MFNITMQADWWRTLWVGIRNPFHGNLLQMVRELKFESTFWQVPFEELRSGRQSAPFEVVVCQRMPRARGLGFASFIKMVSGSLGDANW